MGVLCFCIFKVVVKFVCSFLKQPVQRFQLKAGLESAAHVGQYLFKLNPAPQSLMFKSLSPLRLV